MKSLLIIGAGGHGQVVKEIAQDLGYERIDFIDDHNSHAIGKIKDLENFKEYRNAFVGIENNKLRNELIDLLERLGYQVPVLIHPTAYISRSALIEAGTVVEPQAIVNANTKIKKGSIVSVGAIIDHDVTLGKCVHVNAGAIVEAGGKVKDFEKLEAGSVRRGFRQALVAANSNDEFVREEKEKTGMDISFFLV